MFMLSFYILADKCIQRIWRSGNNVRSFHDCQHLWVSLYCYILIRVSTSL